MAERSGGLIDKVKGRFKKAGGDLAGDSKMRREGRKDERRGEAKEDLQAAKDTVAEKAEEVRRTS